MLRHGSCLRAIGLSEGSYPPELNALACSSFLTIRGSLFRTDSQRSLCKLPFIGYLHRMWSMSRGRMKLLWMSGVYLDLARPRVSDPTGKYCDGPHPQRSARRCGPTHVPLSRCVTHRPVHFCGPHGSNREHQADLHLRGVLRTRPQTPL